MNWGWWVDAMSDLDDCRNMLAQVYAFHDGELSEPEMDEIVEHLAACEPCLDHYEVEQAIRALIRRGCSCERAPQALRVRIHQSFASIVMHADW